MTDTYLEPESASLKARLRWLATDLNSETIFTAADRIEQLEAALTQSQDLVDRWINTSAEQHQTIVEMQDALTQSQAEVAAAYERAADVAKEIADQFVGYMSRVERAIRALATTDQTAALDTIRAEARAQGLREAAVIAHGKAYVAYEAILSAINKGAKA